MKFSGGRGALWLVVSLFALLAASSVVLSHWKRHSKAALPSFDTPERCEGFLLIVRRREKMRSSEKVTYRNSPTGLYKRDANGSWRLISDTYMARSASSSLYCPSDDDLDTVSIYVKTKGGAYPYGHKSVPEGVFRLTPRAALGTQEAKSDWVLIGDFMRGNQIQLLEPETIHWITVVKNEDGLRAYEELGSVANMVKSECYLHGTSTRYWSHRDSFGCINLFKDESGYSPWDQMRRNLEPFFVNGEEVALIVSEDEALLDGDGLPQRVMVEFNLKQGRYHAALVRLK